MRKLFFIAAILFAVSCSPCGESQSGPTYHVIYTDGQHSNVRISCTEAYLNEHGCVEGCGKIYMCGVRIIEKR